MVIDVLGIRFHRDEVFAAVLRDVQANVHLVDTIELVRTGEYLLVVVRSGSAGKVVVPFLPGFAAVLRTPKSTFAIGEFDGRVHHIRLLRRDRKADLAHILVGESFCQFAPGFAAIRRLVDARARAAVHQYGNVTETLPRHGVHDVRIAGIHVDFRDARVLVVLTRVTESVTEYLAPGFAAVRGLVETALAAA